MGKDVPARATRVHVAAFGKHPGWDDHIEEIGLDHAALVHVKRVLYAEGIAGNIDAGAWEKLPEEQRLSGFKHQFYWRLNAGLVVGRMWSSRDGKGRTKFPMVVCAVVEGAPAGWVIKQVLPRLEAVEAKCVGTNSAELVRLAIGEARRGMEDEAALLAGAGAPTTDEAGLVRRLVEHAGLSQPGAEGKGQGLTRVLYEVEREMAAFRPTGGTKRTTARVSADTGAQHIRVPKCLEEPGEGARAWMTLLSQEIADSTAMLVIEPMGQRFLDVVVGEPRPAQFFCVRAGDKALALTSDVPYTIDPAFKASAEAKAAAWAKGQLRLATSPSAASTTDALPGEVHVAGLGPTSKRNLVIGAGLGLIAVLALLYVMFGGKGAPAPKNGDTPPVDPPKTAVQPPTPTAPKPETPKPTPKPSTPSGENGDPRSSWTFDESVAQATAMLDRLDAELAAEGLRNDGAARAKLTRAVDRTNKFIRTQTYSAGTKDGLLRDMAAVDAEVAGVVKTTQAELDLAAKRVSQFLSNEADQPQVTTDAMKKAWTAGMKAIDPAQGWAGARQKHAALAAGLKEAELAVAGVAPLTVPTVIDAYAPAIRATESSRREAALRAAAEGGAAGDLGKARDAAASLGTWNGAAQVLIGQAAEVERLIGEGRTAGEPGANGKSVAALAKDMEGSPVWKDLGAAIAPVTARVKALEETSGETAAARLLGAIRDARPDMAKLRAAEAMAAWERLGALDWPATADDLRAAGKALNEDMLPLVGRVSDEARRRELTGRAESVAAAMWSKFVTAAGGDEAGVQAALEGAAALRASPAQEAALPEWARFNLARGRLARAVSGAEGMSGGAKVEALGRAMDEFAAAVKGMSGAEAAGLMAAIEPLRSKGAELDLSKLGPGAAGWRLMPSTEDGVATFTKAGAGGERTVEFRRVEGGGETVAFVSTTEVSVGEFIDAVTEIGGWEAMKGMLPKSDAGGVDPRSGPRVWTWEGSTIAVSKVAGAGDLSKGWVKIKTAMAGREYYPPGVSVDPPTRDHPMQYVSPQAAMVMARAVGCRLPTPEEWKAASGQCDTGGANLRDGTWKKVHDHLRQWAASGPEFPGAGIYWPAGSRKTPLDDATPAVATEDGAVWFLPVKSGSGKFKHAVGNVAEYVFEDAGAMEGVTATKEAVEAVLGKGEKLRIIGASALSPAEEKAETANAVNAAQARSGYSDVGFRLAFGAPKSAAATGTGERLKAALAANGTMKGGAERKK